MAQRADLGADVRIRRHRYGWDDAARQMKAVYEWVLGTADRPACVHLG